jgi:hypothetical protein
MMSNLSHAEPVTEFLSTADLPPGESVATIEFVEGYDSNNSLVHLREHTGKPVIMNLNTFRAMAADFGEGHSGKWAGRRVVLAAQDGEVTMKAAGAPVPHTVSVQKPNVADEIAALLARAISDRTQTAELLREVADLLVVSHQSRI